MLVGPLRQWLYDVFVSYVSKTTWQCPCAIHSECEAETSYPQHLVRTVLLSHLPVAVTRFDASSFFWHNAIE